jgi:hypothetical protein
VEEVNQEAFSEVSFHGAYEPKRAVHWKYIRRYEDWRYHGRNYEGSPSKDLWLDAGWAEQPADPERLYDLILDPNETHSHARDPTYPQTLDDMRARLDRWMLETGDPLLQGPIPLPKSAWRIRAKMERR